MRFGVKEKLRKLGRDKYMDKKEIKALVDSAEFCLVRDWDRHAIRDLIDAIRLIANLPKTEDKDLRLYKRETKKIQQ